ncbi:MAG: DNA-methyltransferase [Weissella confusa]|uniref:DNA-methyltransferase n=1 Tax=Weissella confusa TaxID=1583 RepID=UPI0018F1E2D2|nr:DNA methyltransferase [Weissella confusa]MBJ7680504.1 site-specific DNA-methyltransferase [Weissella confusa]
MTDEVRDNKKALSETEFLNNVVQGDSLEEMEKIPDNSIDMVLVDLPYGTTQNKWDSIIPLDELWTQYHRIVKPNGAMVFTASGVFTAQLMLSNVKEYKYKYVWEKSKATNFLNAKKQPLRKHEDILVFYKKQPTYHPQMTQGEAYSKGVRKNQVTGSYGDFEPTLVESDGQRYPVDVLYFKTAESEGPVVHPTQKPVELGRYLIRTFTNPGDVVLDNTSGSGAFLVAALQEGRNFIGIEKNEDVALFKKHPVDYIEISKSRIQDTLDMLKLMDNNVLENVVDVNLTKGIH